MPPKILERQNPYPADLYLTAAQVCARYGGVSCTSPRPLLIQRRRYWRLHDLLEFERRIVAAKGAAAA